MGSFDIRSASYDEISQFMKDIGEKSFRSQQIFSWINTKWVNSYDEMTNLPTDLRQKLSEIAEISGVECVQIQKSSDGTRKYLLQMHKNGIMDGDGVFVETVLMSYRHGYSVCLSTQAGCRMGCGFCASGTHGLARNLTAGEILAQVIWAGKDQNKAVSNIVLMGMGEPLDNLEAVLRFLKLVNHPKGKNIGMRHITLSTAGLLENIDKLGTYQLQLSLAISLHALDDETRDKLMPINRKNGVRALLETCKRYQEKTGRRVSYEYALIAGVNDSRHHARHLVKVMHDVGGHVNLIPLNPVSSKEFRGSDPETVQKFANVLKSQGVNVTLRQKKGDDIDAACGQLRQKHR